MSRLIALSLIFAILACPLNCLATTFATSSTQADGVSQPAAHCCCCKHCQPAPEADSSPLSGFPEKDDCTCPSCVCAGAVVETDECAINLDESNYGFVIPMTNSLGSDGELSVASAWSIPPLALLWTGISMRIRHKSLQL